MTPLDKLKKQLSEKEIPDTIQLAPGQKILNVKKFIKSHLSFLEANINQIESNKAHSQHLKENPDNWTFRPYWDRLVKLNQLLQKPNP